MKNTLFRSLITFFLVAVPLLTVSVYAADTEKETNDIGPAEQIELIDIQNAFVHASYDDFVDGLYADLDYGSAYIVDEDRSNIPFPDYAPETRYDIYNGKPITFPIEVWMYNEYGEREKLIQGMDYTVLFKNNVNAGTATVIATGRGKYRGTVTAHFTIFPEDIGTADREEDKKIVVKVANAEKAVYTGKEIRPKVTMTKNGKIVSANNYSLRYVTNKNVGQGRVIITGKNNFKGSLVRYFNINPDPIKIIKKKTYRIKKGKRRGKTQIVLTTANNKWKSGKKHTEYIIKIASNKKFTKNVKTIYSWKHKVTKGKKIGLNGKLKKGETYYVKVKRIVYIYHKALWAGIDNNGVPQVYMENGEDSLRSKWSNIVKIKGK